MLCVRSLRFWSFGNKRAKKTAAGMAFQVCWTHEAVDPLNPECLCAGTYSASDSVGEPIVGEMRRHTAPRFHQLESFQAQMELRRENGTVETVNWLQSPEVRVNNNCGWCAYK
jgi:hypothetical protein